MINNASVCELCGGDLPEGEEYFSYHGYSGPCPDLRRVADRFQDSAMTPMGERLYGHFLAVLRALSAADTEVVAKALTDVAGKQFSEVGGGACTNDVSPRLTAEEIECKGLIEGTITQLQNLALEHGREWLANDATTALRALRKLGGPL